MSAQLRQLTIELEEGDVCFAPGDVISGYIVIGVSQPANGAPPPYGADDGMAEQNQLEMIELKLRMHGTAKVKGRHKGNPAKELTDVALDLLGVGELRQCPDARQIQPGSEKLVKFELQLPAAGLCTSLESKSASVLYTLRVALVYRNFDNEIRRVNAVRGFTVVERFDLALLPDSYFEPTAHHLVKKFGLFSCTGGQLRLNFSIWRLENRTDRRVDKVAAVLQQVVVVHGSSKTDDLNLLDVSDIHEDNLALFVDQGTTLKIDRYFALPPLPPSTVALDGTEPSALDENTAAAAKMDNKLHHHYLQQHRRSFSGSRRMSFGGTLPAAPGGLQHHFLRVFYQLSLRVKTGGVEVMEINVPIVIGSLPQRTANGLARSATFDVALSKPPRSALKAPPAPLPPTTCVPHNTFARAAHEVAVPPAVFRVGEEVGRPQALFMQSRKDACAKLGAPSEMYLCSKSQLTFTNKYPFYVNMPTSSKQSRKVSLLANAIRTENSFIAALRKEQSLVSEWKKRKDAEEKTRKMSTSVQKEKREMAPNSASSHPSDANLNGAPTIDLRGSVSTDTVLLQQPTQTTEPNASPPPTVTTVMPTLTIADFKPLTTTVGWTSKLAPAAAQLPPVETTAASNLRRGDSLGDLSGQTVGRIL
uniref:Arrestin-like N-terminal domain-containing protein n=1 Tax=Globodera rostochiensis TaxID=31243 RepID=A0A914GSA5_GLORO